LKGGAASREKEEIWDLPGGRIKGKGRPYEVTEIVVRRGLGGKE
jgi:hypothetical protein